MEQCFPRGDAVQSCTVQGPLRVKTSRQAQLSFESGSSLPTDEQLTWALVKEINLSYNNSDLS